MFFLLSFRRSNAEFLLFFKNPSGLTIHLYIYHQMKIPDKFAWLEHKAGKEGLDFRKNNSAKVYRILIFSLINKNISNERVLKNNFEFEKNNL